MKTSREQLPWWLTSNPYDTYSWQFWCQKIFCDNQTGQQSQRIIYKFDSGTSELAVHHVMTFKTLTQKLECQKNYDRYEMILLDKKQKIVDLGTIGTLTNKSMEEQEAALQNENEYKMKDSRKEF